MRNITRRAALTAPIAALIAAGTATAANAAAPPITYRVEGTSTTFYTYTGPITVRTTNTAARITIAVIGQGDPKVVATGQGKAYASNPRKTTYRVTVDVTATISKVTNVTITN